MKSCLRVAAAVLALSAIVFTGAAAGSREVVREGNLVLVDNGGIFPAKLPKHGDAPVDARLEGEISTVDGTHPPALQHIAIEIDRTIQIDAVGIPTCRLSRIIATTTRAAKGACPDAIVGSGTAKVEVAFSEQAPFSSTGPIVLFNGGVHGNSTTFLLHAYVDVPAPTAIVFTAKATRIHDGRFGTELVATIPRIAGGAASATSFRIDVGRRYTYKGSQKSLLTASCPTGSYVTQGEAEFSDGTELGIHHVFPCSGTGAG